MRMPMVVLAAIAVLLLPGWAKAKDPHNPGGGEYVDTNRKKLTKNYFVVREGQSDQCKIVVGDFGDKPEGAIGGAPYASKNYAKAALKKFPECKGGETDQTADDKNPRKE